MNYSVDIVNKNNPKSTIPRLTRTHDRTIATRAVEDAQAWIKTLEFGSFLSVKLREVK